MKRKSKSVELHQDELVKLVGKEKAEEVMALAHRVNLRKVDLAKIEDRLNKDGLVVLKRGKQNPTTWQFVGLSFVHIEARFNFEKPENLKKANSKNKLKLKTVHEVMGAN